MCLDCTKMTKWGRGQWGRCDDCYDPNMVPIYRELAKEGK